MSPLLWRSVLRHLARHPWQLGLSILGIALGVAVVLAVDLANASARKGFELSMEQVTGRATHRIAGGPQEVPEEVYVRLRLELGLREAAPVVSGYVALAGQPGRLLQVLGVDLFAEAPFRAYLSDLSESGADLTALLIQPGAALLPAELEPEPELLAGEQRVRLHRVGRLPSRLKDIIITDTSTAQALLGKKGRLSHIDLLVPAGAEGERLVARLQDWLPPGLRLG